MAKKKEETVMTQQEFDEKYDGLTTLDSECFENDGRFETYGKDYATVVKYIKKHGKKNIWSLVEAEDSEDRFFVTGMDDNAIYYFISEQKWKKASEKYKLDGVDA